MRQLCLGQVDTSEARVFFCSNFLWSHWWQVAEHQMLATFVHVAALAVALAALAQ